MKNNVPHIDDDYPGTTKFTPTSKFKQCTKEKGLIDMDNSAGGEVGAGVSNLWASLGQTGRRRAVLGHMLSTQTLMKTDEQKKGFK